VTPSRFAWLLAVPLALAGCKREAPSAEQAAFRGLAESAHAAQRKKLDCEKTLWKGPAAEPCYAGEGNEYGARMTAYLAACEKCASHDRCLELFAKNRFIAFPRPDGSPGALDGPGLEFACPK
jgi:hypothetical protein